MGFAAVLAITYPMNTMSAMMCSKPERLDMCRSAICAGYELSHTYGNCAELGTNKHDTLGYVFEGYVMERLTSTSDPLSHARVVRKQKGGEGICAR